MAELKDLFITKKDDVGRAKLTLYQNDKEDHASIEQNSQRL